MPPRFSYWTIIIDGQPTAFRAADQEELQPTLYQLRKKNPGAEMKWFARGRVWDSPDEARTARQGEEAAARDALAKERGRGWRPGGEHKDPREKFKKETFQARRRRDKKAANLAGEARVFPGRRSPEGEGGRPAIRTATSQPPAEPGRPAPSHKTRTPRLRKPR